VAEIGETGAGYETDVARAYDSNFCQGKRPPGTWRPLVQQPSCRRTRSRFSTHSVWRWLYQPYSAPSNSLLQRVGPSCELEQGKILAPHEEQPEQDDRHDQREMHDQGGAGGR